MRKIPENAEKLLTKWNGGKAKLWFYKVSFSELILRLEKKDVKGNLHIICTPCTAILMPKVSWKNCNLQLKIISDDEILGATFLVFDEREKIEIICMGVHFTEDVEPIY